MPVAFTDPDRIECSRCGVATPSHLIDAKPTPGADPDCCDWPVLECRTCYGPGWRPLFTEYR